jgi:hypothetical protein
MRQTSVKCFVRHETGPRQTFSVTKLFIKFWCSHRNPHRSSRSLGLELVLITTNPLHFVSTLYFLVFWNKFRNNLLYPSSAGLHSGIKMFGTIFDRGSVFSHVYAIFMLVCVCVCVCVFLHIVCFHLFLQHFHFVSPELLIMLI